MVRIIMMSPPTNMPAHMADSDGLYSLDLNDNERIALTRVIDDYIDVGTIKQDTFKELQLPATNKNRLLLAQVGNPSAFNEDNSKIFDIQLLKGDFNYPVQGLQIVETTDTFYSVTIFGELNNWYRPLSNLFLNELDIGSDVVDFAWLSDRHINDYLYIDGNATVFPPLVNYGKWFVNCNLSANSSPSQVVFNDYRFWFSPLAVLKAAFCSIGYQLIAPMLEQDEFRQEWYYLLDPDFETANQLDIADRPFRAERGTDSTFAASFFVYANGNTEAGVVLWPSIITDPGSHFIFRPATGAATDNFYGSFYSGGMIGNFHSEGTIRLRIASGTLIPVQPSFVTVRVSIKKSVKFGVNNQADMLSKATTLATREFIIKGLVVAGVDIILDYVLDTTEIKVYQHEIVFVQIELDATLVDGGGASFDETVFYSLSGLLTGSFFENSVTQQVIEEGDTLDFGVMMRKDLTPIDLFRGLAHHKNLKVETNTVLKKVYAYPEFEFVWYKSGLQEGYFLSNSDEPFDGTLKIQRNSMKQSFDNTDLARDVYLKFLDSSDGFITRQKLEDELHSKKVDLGPNFKDGEQNFENPFLEPLDIGIDTHISGISVVFGPSDIRQSVSLIPFMWDSEPTDDNIYPEKGLLYTPRTAIAYPIGSNDFPPSVTGQTLLTKSSFVYEDVIQTGYNLFGQIFPDGIVINSLMGVVFPDMANVYGNGKNPLIADYYELFYSRAINQTYFGIVLDFLVLLDLVDFSNVSFRRKWKVKYQSGLWGEIIFYARLSRIDDYVIGENLTTPVQLITDSNNFDNC